MINVNNATDTAFNTDNGATCRIMWDHGKAYTNVAGLLLLEEGIIKPRNLRAILSMARTRAKSGSSKRFMELCQPIEVNGAWFYSVSGWNKYRSDLITKV